MYRRRKPLYTPLECLKNTAVHRAGLRTCTAEISLAKTFGEAKKKAPVEDQPGLLNPAGHVASEYSSYEINYKHHY